MSRSLPSYGPIDACRASGDVRRRHRAHRPLATLAARHPGSGTPQVTQTAPVNDATASQQAPQTAPSSGWASGSPQLAHGGAKAAAIDRSRRARHERRITAGPARPSAAPTTAPRGRRMTMGETPALQAPGVSSATGTCVAVAQRRSRP